MDTTGVASERYPLVHRLEIALELDDGVEPEGERHLLRRLDDVPPARSA